MCLTGVRAGASAPRVVREGLPEEVTFLQSLEVAFEAVGTAWSGVEAGVLETHKEGGSRVPGFGAPGMPGGVRAAPWHLRGPHFAPRRGAAGRGGREKRQGPFFPRPAELRRAMGRARPLAAALGTARRPRPGRLLSGCPTWRCKGDAHSPRYI